MIHVGRRDFFLTRYMQRKAPVLHGLAKGIPQELWSQTSSESGSTGDENMRIELKRRIKVQALKCWPLLRFRGPH